MKKKQELNENNYGRVMNHKDLVGLYYLQDNCKRLITKTHDATGHGGILLEFVNLETIPISFNGVDRIYYMQKDIQNLPVYEETPFVDLHQQMIFNALEKYNKSEHPNRYKHFFNLLPISCSMLITAKVLEYLNAQIKDIKEHTHLSNHRKRAIKSLFDWAIYHYKREEIETEAKYCCFEFKRHASPVFYHYPSSAIAVTFSDACNNDLYEVVRTISYEIFGKVPPEIDFREPCDAIVNEVVKSYYK